MSGIQVTETNFEQEVLKSDVPVLVDFGAEWCAPCHMVAPVLEEIASELTGKLKVVKVDVDGNRQLAAQYRIMSIPAMFIFKGGQVVDQIIGALPKDHILARVNKVLS